MDDSFLFHRIPLAGAGRVCFVQYYSLGGIISKVDIPFLSIVPCFVGIGCIFDGGKDGMAGAFCMDATALYLLL